MSFSVKVLNYIHLILTFQKMPVIIVKNSSKTKLQRSKLMLNRLWLGRRSGNSGQCKNLLPGELSSVGVHEEEAESKSYRNETDDKVCIWKTFAPQARNFLQFSSANVYFTSIVVGQALH